jgi:hypothetical protein
MAEVFVVTTLVAGAFAQRAVAQDTVGWQVTFTPYA